MTWVSIISVLLAYLLGAIPFGYILVKLRGGSDVRAVGSGSTGATNVTRATGPAIGAIVLLLDLAKGYSAVWLSDWLTVSDERFVAAAAVAAILGHSFPVFLQFRGGKSVATGVGVFLYLTPLAVPAAFGFWILAMLIWRYVSLASVLAAALYPLAAYFIYRPSLEILLAAVVCAAIIMLRHHANLNRLAAGTEPKFSFKK